MCHFLFIRKIFLNKYDPQFDLPAYTTPAIRCDYTSIPNLIRFTIYDRDYVQDGIYTGNASLFRVVSNDTNFKVTVDPTTPSGFILNYAGQIFYNINNAHRYVVLLTVYDSGVPQRMSNAFVFVPIINYNCFAPNYTQPAILVAAITFEPNRLLGILNAWDLDGDKVCDTRNDRCHLLLFPLLFVFWKKII